MIYKKTLLALFGVLSFTQQSLDASQICDTLSNKHKYATKKPMLHAQKKPMLVHHKNWAEMNLKGKPLPQDFSDADLTNANLAEHHFSCTNFTGAQLTGVILTNTTCNYIQYFQNNVLSYKRLKDQFYLDKLPTNLQSIAQVYPTLSEDRHKAELLHISSGFAHLPYYEGKEFYIKLEYWSCKLFMLNKQIGGKLVYTLPNELLHEATNYCWKTDYPAHLEYDKGMQIAKHWCIITIHCNLPNELGKQIQHYLTEPPQPIHADFDQYLQLFKKGLAKYNVKSSEARGYNYYKNNIEENIRGLKKAYPKLTYEKLQKEAISIAHQLSQQYKNQHLFFLLNFLNAQNRLIRLKKLANKATKNDIYYNRIWQSYDACEEVD